MPTIGILGAGRVGGLIARDLASDPELDVVAFDGSVDALARLDDAPLRVD